MAFIDRINIQYRIITMTSEKAQLQAGSKKSLKDGASSRERMVLTNVKNYSKLGEKFFKRI